MIHSRFNKKKKVLKYSLLFLWLLFTCIVLVYQVSASCKCKRDNKDINSKATKQVQELISRGGNSTTAHSAWIDGYVDIMDSQLKYYKQINPFGGKHILSIGMDSIKTEILVTQRVITILKDSLMSNINREVFEIVGDK
ncbi:MAG: hypothetical protein PHX21_13090 [bacterium]|nr:hypothetical protein [bacterium]